MKKRNVPAAAGPASPEAAAWAARAVDPDFLLESGLLFLLNHEVLNPLGMALAVRPDALGGRVLALQDRRANPEQMVFDAATAAAGREKLDRFMREWGRLQLQRRRLKLGREIQDINPKDE